MRMPLSSARSYSGAILAVHSKNRTKRNLHIENGYSMARCAPNRRYHMQTRGIAFAYTFFCLDDDQAHPAPLHSIFVGFTWTAGNLGGVRRCRRGWIFAGSALGCGGGQLCVSGPRTLLALLNPRCCWFGSGQQPALPWRLCRG